MRNVEFLIDDSVVQCFRSTCNGGAIMFLAPKKLCVHCKNRCKSMKYFCTKDETWFDYRLIPSRLLLYPDR